MPVQVIDPHRSVSVILQIRLVAYLVTSPQLFTLRILMPFLMCDERVDASISRALSVHLSTSRPKTGGVSLAKSKQYILKFGPISVKVSRQISCP